MKVFYSGAQEKQIVGTAKQFLDDLFVPRSDSFPHEPRRNTHSFSMDSASAVSSIQTIQH